MANSILVNLCLSDLPKEFMKAVSTKNGDKKYINLVVGERKSADERGNDYFVKVYVPKDKRKEGDASIFVGSGKTMGNNAPSENHATEGGKDDDLPF